jgi:hypothetical protein
MKERPDGFIRETPVVSGDFLFSYIHGNQFEVVFLAVFGKGSRAVMSPPVPGVTSQPPESFLEMAIGSLLETIITLDFEYSIDLCASHGANIYITWGKSKLGRE